MKYPLRFLYFLWLLVFLYGVIPVILLVFNLVYFAWHLKFPSKVTMDYVKQDWHQVSVPMGKANTYLSYRNAVDYLLNRNPEIKKYL